MFVIWENTPILVNINKWVVSKYNLKEALEIQSQSAELANECANKGYLVLAAASGGGGHVAVVAPQATSYKSLPERPEFSGTGLDSYQGNKKPVVLYDYPVFLQAGTYTGVVPPGYAFNRTMLKENRVIYFVYNP